MKICIPLLFSFVGLLSIFDFRDDEVEKNDIRMVEEYVSFKQLSGLPLRRLPKKEAWRKAAPKIEAISIPRKEGEPAQPALWYHSGGDRKKPLLLVLHSWSADYLQHYSIPYGVFAERNDWIFIHPDFRGEFDDEEATASEEAVADVLAALAYAKENAPVDPDRIFLAGFSGGAMMSLIMIGRYPDQFSAALVWVPVYDLNDWHRSLGQSPHDYVKKYLSEIDASCGGDPESDPEARQECRTRSPSTYLSNARGKPVRVFISGGTRDPFVPPSHAVRAYNDLCEKDRIVPEADYRHIDRTGTLPENLEGQGLHDRFFEEAGLPVVLARTSNHVTLYLFDGGHDIVYNAGLKWLSEQSR